MIADDLCLSVLKVSKKMKPRMTAKNRNLPCRIRSIFWVRAGDISIMPVVMRINERAVSPMNPNMYLYFRKLVIDLKFSKRKVIAVAPIKISWTFVG